MDLATKIKSARERLGISSSDLARRSGIAQATLHDLESGKSKSTRSNTLARLAAALQTTPNWLVGGTGPAPALAGPSREEVSLLEAFRSLTATERRLVLRMVRALAIDKLR